MEISVEKIQLACNLRNDVLEKELCHWQAKQKNWSFNLQQLQLQVIQMENSSSKNKIGVKDNEMELNSKKSWWHTYQII